MDETSVRVHGRPTRYGDVAVNDVDLGRPIRRRRLRIGIASKTSAERLRLAAWWSSWPQRVDGSILVPNFG
ncbi:hypothetical protein [Actinoallomurus sp. CA-150999]|uniref:hypothetical protein n=1 Tax=Actinoallomurus sp. CA-150999 TaxID=3239887 RepID=UPI003D8CAA8C